jgi:hypothetical protein
MNYWPSRSNLSSGSIYLRPQQCQCFFNERCMDGPAGLAGRVGSIYSTLDAAAGTAAEATVPLGRRLLPAERRAQEKLRSPAG